MSQSVTADTIISSWLTEPKEYITEEYYIELNGEVIKTFVVREVKHDTGD